MNRRFVNIENSLCGLEQKVTEYYIFDDMDLVLDSYYENTRPTKRHKFKIGKRWERLSGRDSNIDEPVIRDAVKDNILLQARSAIYFRGEA